MTKPKIIHSFDGEYRFLSNFWEDPANDSLDNWTPQFTYKGLTWRTVEHAFQAMKTLDNNERMKIRNAPTPSYAKRLGRTVTLRPHWDNVKIGEMRNILALKFAPGSDLAEKLIATGDAELIEGNTWNDTFWGVCRGVGENWLGKLLMERRAELVAMKV